ncbi:MAG: type I-E CRISPR-associated protein Cse1/CasA [Spongiibacteraceae bacterium]|nr:type I-E CRISPR-associated protein Cse1/CasA [Spongiibacteraceae bacterium]
MNLLHDPWIPTLREDGTKCQIAPWQIAETHNPVIELAAPRPDFQGALYQCLIGLLQTTLAPDDTDEWLEKWQTVPAADSLKNHFAGFSDAFELDNADGPSFLQDFDLPSGEVKPVEALLIDAPGSKTRKDNLDHFVKGGRVEQMCLSCAATSLFTLQSNAPSGGAGHRVGLRGGGPLTTLVMPEAATTLWQKLWANVFTQEEFEKTIVRPDMAVFPWLAPTRCSDKTGQTTFPDDVHPLQQYWGMPRRIRLHVENGQSCYCSLCGLQTQQRVTTFHTKNYGTNYDGPWVHPLTPYRFDPKKKNIPLSLKGQQGGLGYRHWLALNWHDTGNGDQAAAIVRVFNDERMDLINDGEYVRLWCFGFDMDNMKARCWYEHTLPLVSVSKERQTDFFDNVAQLLSVAKEAASMLRTQVKAAWFKRPADVKGDMSQVVTTFWQQTETDFYRQLNALSQWKKEARCLPAGIAKQWLSTVQQSALFLFDQWVMEGDIEEMNMKRVVSARRVLEKKLFTAKPFKELRQISQAEMEASP